MLQSLPEVDKSRIGFIGHSYGGRTALFAPVYDRRIKASVSSCGSTTYKEMLIQDSGIQPEFVLPNILEHGDLEDIVKLIEPANILIIGTDDDIWSLNISDIQKHACNTFKKGTLQTKLFKGKHQFGSDMRLLAYQFLEKHL